MSAQTILEARLRARDDGLVGQLTASEQRAKGAAGGLRDMAGAGRTASAATNQVAASDREAARAAREVERARKDQERAARAAARAEQQAADVIARAQARHRAGQMQLGQQAQDFLIQVQGGTPILTAFSQQASQAQFAIAMMGGETDKSSSKIAKFASIMGGPFGIALGVAIPLVSMFAAKLFEGAEAASAAEMASSGLSQAQSVMGEIFDLTTGKIKAQNEMLILNARIMSANLRLEAEKARTDAVSGLADAKDAPRGGFGLAFQRILHRGYGETGLAISQRERQRLSSLVTGVEQGGISADEAARLANDIDFSRAGIDKSAFLTALANRVSAEAKVELADLIDKSLAEGQLASEFRKAGPKGPKARSGAGAANALANFGESAAEKIARIADSYNPAPRALDKAFADLRAIDGLIADLEKRKPPSFEKLIGEAKGARAAVMDGIAAPLDAIQQRLVPLPDGIVKAQAAVEELDGVIAVLSARKPPNWEQLVARAERLKIVAVETVDGPLTDMLKTSRDQWAQQLLMLQGREREAQLLARIQDLTAKNVPLTATARKQIEATVAIEERINDLLEKRQDIISIYMSSIGDLRGALEELFSGGSGGDFLKNSEQLIKRFRGSMAVEAIFGDSLRALEKRVRGKTPLDREIDDLAEQIDGLEGEAGRSSAALKMFTDAVAAATADINRSTARGAIGQGAKSFLGVFGQARGAASADAPIVVSGNRPSPIGAALMREQNDFLRDLARAQYEPLAKLFDEYLGGDFFRKLSPVFEGAYAGFFTAGPIGGILGAAKELPGLPDKLKGTLAKAFGGAQTGSFVAGVGKSLGLKMSTTGSQIGGAVGSFLPIPGGDIIGSIAGGLLGGLFKKSRSAGAVITGVDDYTIGGKDKKNYGAAEGLAGSVTGGLQRIAEALDATVGSFYTTIGVRGGDYRVNTSGSSLKIKNGARDFGDDEAGAIAYAIADAIGDGAIKGLSAAMQKALRSSTDIDKAVQEALKVREVEELLGGIGSAIERQFREFEEQAKERVRIATQYGFDVSKIEARNAEDRAKLVEQILSSRVGSLQQLLDDLKFGDLFEGTAAERRDKLLTEIAAAKSDAEKGVDGAADKLADLTRQLVETSRDAYGTAGSEYASDRSNAISTAEAIIAAENERIRAAQQATVDTSKAMQTQNQLTNETNDILAEMRAILRAGGGGVVMVGGGGGGNISRNVDLR
ncbi:hypothetical protein [Sphingopyxis sp. FD7]|uniref:hypothetical protein n=1 Tax=Sphingopyxis sp. FD7 TaxID=1914525 RepID=UPI000DC6256B|nr:hypothetical protein [Sphingopyxis sp. FD7]BBB13421.1 hypothetical protein SPYCA_2679 [Sphingopyxis sp. FD7]